MKFLKNYIRFTYVYAKENIFKYILINSIFFVITGLIAFFALKAMSMDKVEEIYLWIYEIMDSKDVVNQDGSLSFFGIFFNNFRAGALISLYGFIPFLFLPIVFVVLNSVIIGALMGVIDVATNENIVMLFIKYILPHGIFEIPALIIEGAIGTKICSLLCRKIFRKATEESFLYHLKGCLGIFVFYVIPLLIIAAFIEAVVLDIIYF